MSDSVGSRDARLFELVYPTLSRFAGAVRPSGVDPDDLVQEALARTLAVRSLDSLDDPAAYLRTAVVRVASNLARGRRRSRDRTERMGPPAGEIVDLYPSDLADLMRVSPRARAVLFLVYIEDQPYRNAASILGCTEDAARRAGFACDQTAPPRTPSRTRNGRSTMSELHELLEELADHSARRGAEQVLAGATARAARLRRRRQVTRGAALAVVMIVIIAVGSMLVARPSRHHLSVANSHPMPTRPRPTKPLDEMVLPNSAAPPLLSAVDGRVWIADAGLGNAPGHLLDIDPISGSIRGDTELAGNAPFAIAADATAVWVRSQQNERATYLQKIDTRTHRVVATRTMQRDGGLAVSPDTVWAIDGSGSLLRIDATTAHVIATIPLAGRPYSALFVSVGPQGVLLSNPYDGSVFLVDTANNTVHEIARVRAAQATPPRSRSSPTRHG